MNILRTILLLLFFNINNISIIYGKNNTKRQTEKKKKRQKQNVKKVKKEKIFISADLFEGGNFKNKEEKSYKQLIGNVKVKQKDFTLTADKAIFFDDDRIIEAAGNIKLFGKDNIHAQCEYIKYVIDDRIAYITENVKCTKDDTTFETEEMEYHVDDNVVIYENYGTLKQKNNKLESQEGIANLNTNIMTFNNDITFENDDYLMKCEKIIYNRKIETMDFSIDTKIFVKKNDDYVTTPIGGNYNIKNETITINEGLYHSRKSLIYGDSIFVNTKDKNISMKDNIEIVDYQNNRITCNNFYYNDTTGLGKMRGNILLKKNNKENDDLLIIADRVDIQRNQSDIENNEKQSVSVKVSDNVKMYSKNFQCKSVGFTYKDNDNKLIFDDKPTFWSKQNQITGENVVINIDDNDIKDLQIGKDAFVILKSKEGFFNQVKSNTMNINFDDGKFENMHMDGNVDSLFFVVGDKNHILGANRIKCPKMTIKTNENTVPTDILFLKQSTGVFYPSFQAYGLDVLLPGFHLEQGRPKKRELLDRQTDSHIPQEEIEDMINNYKSEGNE